ncbi:MAG: DUF4229 domain-containing protein [Dietzia sp.]|nr:MULTISPECIES: DUF4229 domain-containing protein [Dietzia]MBB1035987.1 DUF4229 domain-containing protein [Dietzia sp. CQ4]MBB1039386.1 DUF4229 domain-containing protein [Dietzia natronolimnaea]MBB1040109.1 DUF4229 domain-containing protein [Dietzia sp. Cai40]MBB1044374.1 DUF4229 domain-containing protein [Dietzia sp. DQ11-44]MBB1047359.1 DUF4229 domain-containing protein [Dietzia cercidiphylli]
MSERDESAIPAQVTTGTRPGARLARNMMFYTVLRLLMVVALTLVIIGIGRLAGVDVPVLVAAILSVVVALPLSMILFTRLRAEINSDISAVDADRRAKREDLRRRMDEA